VPRDRAKSEFSFSIQSNLGSMCEWAKVEKNDEDIPGVNGGEQHRVQSPPARISLCTSPSQPSFTPFILSRPMYEPVTGVGNTPQVEGGLLVALPDEDSGGVDG